MRHLRKCWIPKLEVQLQETPWQESSISLWLIFLEQVETKWNNASWPDFKKSHVGSEDWNDVTFTRQGIRWMNNPQSGTYIDASQQKAIHELKEIPVERNTKEDLHSTPAMHTKYRSVLGQINWLQSRTQLQCCHKFSKCASRAASPTIGNVKALNKLARQLKSQPVKLSVLATHRIVENNCISWCLLPKQRRWIFTERHGSVPGRITWADVKKTEQHMEASLTDWEYLDFLMPPTKITKTDLHKEAWQCSNQNRVTDQQRTECHMEVWLIMKSKRLKTLCFPLPWRSCIPSWNVLVHASFSVDCGRIFLVKLQISTWGLMSLQQEQFICLFREYSWSSSHSKSKYWWAKRNSIHVSSRIKVLRK